jgi:outer membrane protein assembly factor BamB
VCCLAAAPGLASADDWPTVGHDPCATGSASAGLLGATAGDWPTVGHDPCATGSVSAGLLGATADDWPTVGHDNQRTGVTSETLLPPLQLRWTYRAPSPPAPGWSPPANGYGVRKNKSEACFDDAFRVIAVGDVSYFCSSAENTLYAVDAGTGRVRWTWSGEAAPRLTPAYHDGRLYFGADDGKVYCLNAEDGRAVWVFDAALTPEKMLGYGRFSSVWPIRTGVLIDGGTAYFAAGLFASEGIFFIALDAANGRLRWRRQIDREVTTGLPPQGELLATRDSLFLTSRVAPTRWSKTDGRLLPFFTPFPEVENAHEYRFYNGGTDARIWQNRHFVYGSGCLLAYDPDQVRTNKYGRKEPGELVFNWFNGRQIVFADKRAFVATDYHVLGVDPSRLPELARGPCYEFEKLYKRLRIASRLDWMEEHDQIAAQFGADHPWTQWIQNGPLKWSRAAWEEWPRASQAVFAKMAQQVPWMTPLAATESLILAGRILYAGGEGVVYAIDTQDGRVLWSEKTAGRVRGLAVSHGRLYVSTTDGCVRCYVSGSQATAVVDVQRPGAGQPATSPPLPEPCRRVVEHVAAAWKDQPGYCLVLGGGDGWLAQTLAQRTKLHIQVLDDDEAAVRISRARLLAAGLHGWRVCLASGDLTRLPYPPYLFNVVIDQRAVCSGDSPTPAAEALRVARPLGGVVYRGDEKGDDPRVAATEAPVPHLVRGKLPGTADWTHNYGTAANTYSNGDQQVRGPFGVLWYGEPGPRERIDRHATPPIPLVTDGILFTVGQDRLMAFDVYNGVKHWERRIRGVGRSGLPLATANMVAHGGCLYAVIEDRECWQIDARTGRTLRVYAPPPRKDAEQNYWAWIATDGQRLYGSRAVAAHNRPDTRHSDELFAIAIATGELCWQRRVGLVEHDGIALGGGRVYFADRELTDSERSQAARTPPKDTSVPDRPAVDRRGRPIPPDLRKLVTLDAATGQPVWQRPFDATDITLDDNAICDGRVGVASMYHDGVVVVHGTGSLGHPHREFLAGEFARRALYAFASDDGRYVWGGRLGYRKRPIIVGDYIYAEPFAWELKTGRRRQIENPLSGRLQDLDFHRGYIGCSHLLGSGVALFGNKPGISCWNLDSAAGFLPWDDLVFGCGICATPANGVFVAPEGRSGCACAVGIHTSLALYPRSEGRAWGIGLTGGRAAVVSLPVRHLAINLGAPGWREDARQRLWIPYPARGESGILGPWLPRYKHNDGQFYYVAPELLKIGGTDQPWLYTSGCQAETDLGFRLLEKDAAPARYTVRLHFAEPDEIAVGQRVFQVSLQGEPVLRDFDIVQQASGPRRALVKEFRGIRVTGELTIGLRSAAPACPRPPILCALEALREADQP